MLYQTENPHGGDIYGGDITLDFSANTNPFGTPPGVVAAMAAALPEVHRYPDPYCRALVAAIAAHEKVPEGYILCGNGAAELIYGYCQALGPARGLELAPTFSEYALSLERAGGVMERYFLGGDFALEEDFLEVLEGVQAVFLCNPNNPTGQTISRLLLEKILSRCAERGIRLFVDECFLDLSDDGVSLKDCLSRNPNLFILKAFTKSYGMAGVRLGYCMCADRELLGRMARAVQPWNVSTLAQAAGVAALGETEFLRRTRALILQERRYLAGALERLGFRVCPSRANYLLFRAFPGLDRALRRQGIAIRSCANYHGLEEGWYRVAVRQHEENGRLVAAMESVCAETHQG